MAETAADTRSVESIADFGSTPESMARRWKTEIALAQKERKTWVKDCRKIIKRYRDERGEKDTNCRFNVLWSNVQTLGPAVYSKAPQPIVERRYRDRDPIGRIACRLLERTLAYQIEVGYFHKTVKLCRDDYLLTGQGVNWIRYEPEYEGIDDKLSLSEGGEAAQPQPDEAMAAEESYDPAVISEKTCVDYVHWEDYLCSPARVEDEITWKAKRAFLSRDQLKKRFSKLTKQQLQSIPLDHCPAGMDASEASKPENELLKKATVWEIWDKESRKVIFLAESWTEQPLEVVDDPLKLHCFWPTPDACVSTVTTNSVVPVPDYHQYKDQAQELDDLTTRISLLTDAIRAAGVYDASIPELRRLLEDGDENKLYPCDNWAALSEKGGIPGGVSFLPIKEMAEVLIRLYEARQQVKNDLYEITGISDIVRGMSSGSAKTATEQRIKGQFANLRLQDRQAELSRFTRDTLIIMAEIIAEHFSPETIFLMSSYEQWGIEDHLPPDMPEQPAPPPMMGHNGGPPMGGPQMPPQGPPQPPMQGPPPMQGGPEMPAGAPPMPPQGAMPPQGPQPGPMPPQQGMLPMAPPLPQGGTPIQMPPPVDPMVAVREKAMADFAAAVELLRNDKLRGFRIDIETDSTIDPDPESEKQSRVEFLTAASGFLGQALEIGMAAPELRPLLGKMLLFGVRGFRAGRELETSFEETLDALEKDAKQPKPPQPSPEEIKAKAEAEKMQMEMQARQQEMQAEAQRQQAEDQRQAQLSQMEMQFKEKEYEMKMAEMVRKTQIEMLKHQMEMEKLQANVAMEGQKLQIQSQNMQMKAAYDAEAQERQAQYDDRSAERQAQSDERKATIAEQAMKAKANAAGKSASK
jgi:hypothetical protein